ncbi:MAG: alpha/beta fold hydrolase [Actinomycetota bacterium]|nr:alpha/beta fold hydrolase [Actinomycetota bacterium]
MGERLSIETSAGTFDAVAAGPADGRPVLLLHGFPQSSLEWDHQLHALGDAGYRAVAFDQRGYSPGARPAEVGDYAVKHLVADVLAVADSVGWTRFDLVGHDWGAVVAWVAASRHPARIRTLTAVSVPHPVAFQKAIDGDEDQGRRSRYIGIFHRPGVMEATFAEDPGAVFGRMFGQAVPADHVRRYVERFAEKGALTAALNWYRANVNLGESVGEVVTPTLYVWSTEDVAVGAVAARDCEKWVTGPYRFEVLDGVSHWVPEQAADRLGGLLIEHFEAHPA